MNRRYSILFFFVLLSVLLSIGMKGQTVLIKNRKGLIEFDLQNCTVKQKCNRDNQPLHEFYDITVTPDSNIYGAFFFASNYLFDVGSIGASGGGVDSCTEVFESAQMGWFFDGNTALNCNKSGVLFCLTKRFCKYYPDTKTWEYLGHFPDFSDGHDSDSGDEAGSRTFTRRGERYYFINGNRQVVHYGWMPTKLIELDTINPINSKIIFTFDTSTLVSSMFTIRESCDDYTTYVRFSEFSNASHDSLLKWGIGILDFETFQITDYCINFPTNPFGEIRGVADPWTIYDFKCKLIIDLDMDNSSGTTDDLDYQDSTICQYDSINITDLDPEVFAYDKMDSIRIWIAGSPPDGDKEYLRAPQYTGVTVIGSGTQRVTLINKNIQVFSGLELTIRNMTYHNSSALPTPGIRKIAFLAYGGTRQSDTAYAYINLIDDIPDAGRDTLVGLCIDDAPVEIDNLLSQGVDTDGEWLGSTTTQGIFDPQADEPVTLLYIVSREGCEPDTAMIEIEVEPLPVFDLGADTTICPGEALELTCETDAESYLWQDGSDTKSYEVTDSGLYLLTIENSAGCTYTDSIKISYYPDVNTKTDIDTMICEGDMIEWHSQQIDQEGDYEYKTDNIHGCDSTVILHVMYYPGENTRMDIDTTICSGDKIEWHNQEISTEGEYEYITPNEYGCDSTIVLHVSYYPLTEAKIYGDELMCKGDTVILTGGEYPYYHWNTGDTTRQIEATKQGWYYLEIRDENGCSATDSIYISQVPALQIEVTITDESCYGQSDGSIMVEYVSGGTGDKVYYLNGNRIQPGEERQNLSPGQYLIEASDSLGCQWSEEVTIAPAPYLWVDLGEDIRIESTSKLPLEAQTNIVNPDKVMWIVNGTDVGNDKLTYDFTGVSDAEIEVILTDGCEVRDTLNIEVIQKEDIEIYIPDIFTPDGDGVNDTWAIRTGKQIARIKYIAIYDRWGERVYERQHIPVIAGSTGLWDGRYKGKPVNPGVYVYIIRLEMEGGKTITKSGDITAVR